MEEITTRDESSHISPNGQRVLPSGGISADGPPTTLSGTGVDRMAFAQANITRDNTKFVNGTIVGERNVFQVSHYAKRVFGHNFMSYFLPFQVQKLLSRKYLLPKKVGKSKISLFFLLNFQFLHILRLFDFLNYKSN